MSDELAILVVADTSVLINFVHVGRLDLLGPASGLRVLVPLEVKAELVDPVQRAAVDDALAAGALADAGPLAVEELTEYARLRATLGSGESAALSIAVIRGAIVACDERRAFLRAAETLLGPGRVVNTPGLLLRAIHRGTIEVAAADDMKAELERRRFKMSFGSFADLLGSDDAT